jgi:hypothetical protein
MKRVWFCLLTLDTLSSLPTCLEKEMISLNRAGLLGHLTFPGYFKETSWVAVDCLIKWIEYQQGTACNCGESNKHQLCVYVRLKCYVPKVVNFIKHLKRQLRFKFTTELTHIHTIVKIWRGMIWISTLSGRNHTGQNSSRKQSLLL